MPDVRSTGPVPLETWYLISQFLFAEAALLDARAFDDWLDLVADDVRYWMPTRHSRRNSDIAAPDAQAFLDETKTSLRQRLGRLRTSRAWAEEPPSRTRRLITNVRASNRADGHFDVAACFLLYRTRLDYIEDTFVGSRLDILRATDNRHGFVLAARTIILDQSVVRAHNISMLF